MARFRIAAGLAAMFAAGFFISAPASAESVMKQCGDEWKAAKAANATKGQTWRDFLKDCRTRHAETPAATTTTTAPAPAPAAEPAPAPKPAATRASRTPHATAGEFASEAQAKGHCPADMVVWVNNRTHKYHYNGDRYYGTTKHGAYMCEGEAKAAGDAAAKNSKPKS